uniref:Uncharacterized protein n=1 Tax=Chelydra serpentina TaxID=8475 RepID=A0A8C3SWN8_CHESE
LLHSLISHFLRALVQCYGSQKAGEDVHPILLQSPPVNKGPVKPILTAIVVTAVLNIATIRLLLP